METVIIVLLAAALVCFLLEVFSVTIGTVKLIALGLAFWVAAVLLPHLVH
jgi:hypothetical protein